MSRDAAGGRYIQLHCPFPIKWIIYFWNISPLLSSCWKFTNIFFVRGFASTEIYGFLRCFLCAVHAWIALAFCLSFVLKMLNRRFRTLTKPLAYIKFLKRNVPLSCNKIKNNGVLRKLLKRQVLRDCWPIFCWSKQNAGATCEQAKAVLQFFSLIKQNLKYTNPHSRR